MKILIICIAVNLYNAYVHSSRSRKSSNRSQIEVFKITLNSRSQHQSSPKRQHSFRWTTSITFGQCMSWRSWSHRKLIVKRQFLVKINNAAPMVFITCHRTASWCKRSNFNCHSINLYLSIFLIFNFIVKLVFLPSEENDFSSFSRRGGRKC